jgi:hypothetical protein
MTEVVLLVGEVSLSFERRDITRRETEDGDLVASGESPEGRGGGSEGRAVVSDDSAPDGEGGKH